MNNTEPIIYNVTTMVSNTIVPAWIEWMQQQHIPAVMATNCFTHHVFAKLLDVDETEGQTFTTQYFAASNQQYQQYVQQFAAALRVETLEKWQQQIVAFRSVMQVVY
jgi:hypothetical protein